MNIIIDNELRINLDEIDDEVLSHIKKDFRTDNPHYNSNDDNDEPKYLNLYNIDESTISFPRGMSNDLCEYLDDYEIEYDFIDNRKIFPQLDFPKLLIKPYKYQEKAIKKATMVSQGTIESPCFVGNTQIKTIDGYKDIKDVVVGDLVYCWDIEKRNIRIKPVINKKKIVPNERLVRVTIEDNNGDEWTVTCTENHKFYTEENRFYEWVKAKDLLGRKVLINDNPELDYRCYDFLEYHKDKSNAEIGKMCDVSTSCITGYKARTNKDVNGVRIPCACGCGFYAKYGSKTCRGHHQVERFKNMSDKEKQKVLKNWIDAGYSAMMKGRDEWFKNASEEELKEARKGLKKGNKASLKSELKSSQTQNDIYYEVCNKFQDYTWVNNKIFNICGNEKFIQCDIYCKELKLVIECDGPTHYEPIFGKARLEKQIKRDDYINRVLNKNGITIIRVKCRSSRYSNDFDVILKNLFDTVLKFIDGYIDGGVINI